MPRLLRCLLPLSLLLCLAACTASAPRQTAKKPPADDRPTVINAPAKPATGPARTLTPSQAPAPQAAPAPGAAPAETRSAPIVMGAPLPGTQPAPVPFAAAGSQPRPIPPDTQAIQAAPSGQTAPAIPAGAPSGFAGMAWGASAKTVAGLAVHDVDAPVSVVTYTWPAGPKDIAGAPIREAFYEFYQDRFYHVWIDYDGMEAYKAALAGLTAAYGPPTTENLEKYYHAWSLGDVNVYCAYHPAEKEGDVSFFYQPLYERLAAARKAGHAKGGPARGKRS